MQPAPDLVPVLVEVSGELREQFGTERILHLLELLETAAERPLSVSGDDVSSLEIYSSFMAPLPTALGGGSQND